jgi:ABC-type nitrate/sulfonate/bicarbonate transport system permease component
VPHIWDIASALFSLLSNAGTYRHMLVTGIEVLCSIVAGTALALLALLIATCAFRIIGAMAVLFYWLAPTPKIIFFPIALGLFGVDVGSKIAIGALSVFFPVALSLFSAMRQIKPIYLDVGRSFGLGKLRMFSKIYAPCLWSAALTGLRLGAGLGVIGVLLAETKLSNRGLGFLAVQYYSAFRIRDLYAVLILSFTLAALINATISYLESRRKVSS